jgi:type II secretory pathway component PulF
MKAIAFVGILAFAIAICITWLAIKRTQKTRKPEDKDALRVQYFDAGVQYYVLARFAAGLARSR